MEEEIREIEQKEVIYHDFYCDSCKKYVGRSQELDDCYYEKLLKLVPPIKFLNNLYYPKAIQLCKNCYEEYLQKIPKELNKLGFTIDKEPF